MDELLLEIDKLKQNILLVIDKDKYKKLCNINLIKFMLICSTSSTIIDNIITIINKGYFLDYLYYINNDYKYYFCLYTLDNINKNISNCEIKNVGNVIDIINNFVSYNILPEYNDC